MTALVRAERRIDAPAPVVWDRVTDWERQSAWVPLTHVHRLDSADRVGGRLRAWTGLGPVGFWDPMLITAWVPPTAGPGRCEVMHTGRVVRGDGGFRVLAIDDDRSTLVWWERLDLPAGPVGRLLWVLVRPVATRMVARALGRLAGQVERDG